MQTPNFVPVQFFDATGLNQQTKTLFGSVTSPLSLLFSPGLINPQDMQVSTSGRQHRGVIVTNRLGTKNSLYANIDAANTVLAVQKVTWPG